MIYVVSIKLRNNWEVEWHKKQRIGKYEKLNRMKRTKIWITREKIAWKRVRKNCIRIDEVYIWPCDYIKSFTQFKIITSVISYRCTLEI